MDTNEQILAESGGKTAGEVLKSQREALGLSLDDVSYATRITKAHIVAIEENDKDALPSRVYAIGFVRTYALYFGLDADFLVQLFKIKTIGRHDPSRISMESDVDESAFVSARTLLWSCFISFMALILIGPLFSPKYGGQAQEKLGIPEVPADLKAKMDENLKTIDDLNTQSQE